MEKKEQEVAEEYMSSLADLNLNSKPLINMLTILAEENMEYAPVIVKAVEQHISKVNPDVKLPVLYLIDSIIKNVGRDYIQLFSHCIVHIFCGVFEKVNEKIREKMYTLRQTWNDVFSSKKLYALDVKVNCIDPNWPITAKVVPKSPAIHVNPIFLKNSSEPLGGMEAQLRDKQRQLLELQKRKLELQLAATKQRLEEQEKQLTIQTESIKPVNLAAGVPSLLNVPIRPPGFNNYRPPNPRSATVLSQNNLAGPQNVPKARIAPVNPIMLNTIRHRDPRLARQHQQIQASNDNPNENNIHASTKSSNSIENSLVGLSPKDSSSSDSFLQNIKKSEDKSSEKSNSRSSSRSYHGDKDKSRSSSSSSGKRSYEKSSSSGRSKSGSRSSGKTSSSSGSKSNQSDRDSRTKDKSSSSPSTDDKRKSSKVSSPSSLTQEKLSPSKQRERSPKRSTVSPSSPPLKFKDMKQNIKPRTYLKRDREKCGSPSKSGKLQDIDLRTAPLPDKRMKLEDTLSKYQSSKPKSGQDTSVNSSITTAISTMTTSVSNSSSNLSDATKSKDLDQNIEAVSNKDVDLRQFQMKTSKSEADAKSSLSPLTAAGKKLSSDEKMDIGDNDSKKRQSGVSGKGDDSSVKKIKLDEKIDNLFGKEDIDLRNLGGISLSTAARLNPALPMTPPPPIISNESENWAKVKGNNSNKISPATANFDDVRAKFAKATKNHLQKLEKGRENRKSRFSDINEDSSDGTDANIRTIISQAHELLANENINTDQYQTLLTTVMQISESKKVKEAWRRESLLTSNKATLDSSEVPAPQPVVENESKKDEENSHTSMLKAKSKALQKRIPKLSKDAVAVSDVNVEQNSVLQRVSPPKSTGMTYTDSRSTSASKPEKRSGRQKETKWSSPWDHGPNSSQNQKPWIPPLINKPIFHSNIPNSHQPIKNPPNRMAIPNPWNNSSLMIFAPNATPVAAIQNPQICPDKGIVAPITQIRNSVDNPKDDEVRTINIDGVAKEIRAYDDIAIAFMDWDQPREIGFKNGQRRIIIDDQEPFILNFNDAYTTILIGDRPHKIRFGFPSRELYIDDNWYECCFGGPPIAIPIDGKVRIFKIEGPAPQVNIGNIRQDLVVGKINVIIDARILIPVFLDAKVQIIEVDGKKHTLQFADNLKTVLIDEEPVNVEYGGLPKSLYLGGSKYFVRFGSLPNGIIPGKIFIKDMICTRNFPLVEPSMSIGAAVDSNKMNPNSILTPFPLPTNVKERLPNPISEHNPSEQDRIEETAECASNSAKSPETAVTTNVEVKSSGGTAIPPVSTLNIDELFQKLLASGILNQTGGVSNTNQDAKKSKDQDVITPIDLSKPETIKTRQSGIVQKLFCGMQCSSCGVRFPPEQTIKYSQHLDWHFRQNRRERDSSRKAHSRKWYYDVSDWVQYEEIEDIDEREKNWFEAQQSELSNPDENSNQRTNSPSPSCPAGPDDVDRACDMCHDKFEQFYNEESEEWHLRSAIRVDDKIYHPLCYQDYKASLVFEETSTAPIVEGSEDDNAVDTIVIKEEKTDENENSSKAPGGDDEDDDVIVVPMEEPIITEIPDDDDDVDVENKSVLHVSTAKSKDESEESSEKTTENDEKITDGASKSNKNDSIESDVEIEEPNIPFTDLDTYEEPPVSLSTVDESSQSSVFTAIKIKEEPKDDVENDDDAFEDVGIFESVDDISESVEEYVPQPIATNQGNENLVSIDGNVDIQETQSSNIGVNKIKINITKNTASSSSSAFSATTTNTITTISSNQRAQNIPVIESGSAIPVICNFKETSSTIIPQKKRDDKHNNIIIEEKMKTKHVEKENGGSGSGGSSVDDENKIDYELKSNMRGIDFKRIPKVKSGLETSGLCSIM